MTSGPEEPRFNWIRPQSRTLNQWKHQPSSGELDPGTSRADGFTEMGKMNHHNKNLHHSSVAIPFTVVF